jgi:pyruvate dehydrogenase E1 component alpha subunit
VLAGSFTIHRSHPEEGTMPIETVKQPPAIERVQVLDKDGNVDEDLEPEIPEDDLFELFRTMVKSRMYDDRRLKLQRQGRIGTFAPSRGQEAAQAGSVYALEDDDWMVQSYRELTANLWRGADLVDDLLYAAGYETGMQISPEAHNTPISIPIASQLCHATGIAWASRLKGEDNVSMVYFGDGSTSEGDFHEGMNFAGVFDAPVVFLNQNNQWAISVPREQQTGSETLAQKAHAYGLEGIQVDGNDILGVYRVTKDAVENARDEHQAKMVEALTYRMGVHTTADDPTKYRSEDEVEPWRERDPIDRFQVYLGERGVLDEGDRENLEEEISEEIGDAVEEFEETAEELGDPTDMFRHHYDENPPYLNKQEEELSDYWERHDVWGDHHG